MKSKSKKTKKPARKAPSKRRAIKPGTPGQAAAALKTFMKLERIKGTISQSAEFLPIHDRWENLLNLAKENRDTGRTHEDKAFFFITMALDHLAEGRIQTDAELIRLSEAIEAKYKEYWAKEGDEWPKEGEYWADGEAPEDMEELRTAYDERVRQVEAAAMREQGEGEIADLYLADEKEYYRRRTAGILLLYADDKEKLAAAKKSLRDIFINQGWEDLLPGLDM